MFHREVQLSCTSAILVDQEYLNRFHKINSLMYIKPSKPKGLDFGMSCTSILSRSSEVWTMTGDYECQDKSLVDLWPFP